MSTETKIEIFDFADLEFAASLWSALLEELLSKTAPTSRIRATQAPILELAQ